jgi:hypothetical protein
MPSLKKRVKAIMVGICKTGQSSLEVLVESRLCGACNSYRELHIVQLQSEMI